MKNNTDAPLDDTDKTAIVSGRAGMHGRMSRAKIDPGLYCFTTLAHFHNIPVDPEQIIHALAIDPREGMSEGDMLRAAKSFKLKARATTVKAKVLNKLPLPVIVGFKEEKNAVLAQIQGDKYLVLLPDNSPPKVLAKDEFVGKWNGKINHEKEFPYLYWLRLTMKIIISLITTRRHPAAMFYYCRQLRLAIYWKHEQEKGRNYAGHKKSCRYSNYYHRRYRRRTRHRVVICRYKTTR